MILAAHALELCLKSFLLASGWDESRVRKEVSHDLEVAWLAAVENGLAIEDSVPYWCHLLNSVHKHPYVGRYPPVNAGLVSVGIEELYEHIHSIITLVEASPRLRATAAS